MRRSYHRLWTLCKNLRIKASGHGGGPEATELAKQLGIEAPLVDADGLPMKQRLRCGNVLCRLG